MSEIIECVNSLSTYFDEINAYCIRTQEKNLKIAEFLKEQQDILKQIEIRISKTVNLLESFEKHVIDFNEQEEKRKKEQQETLYRIK